MVFWRCVAAKFGRELFKFRKNILLPSSRDVWRFFSNMEAAGFSETTVPTYQTTGRHIPEYGNPDTIH
jgi:hypothetical protein